MSQEPQVITLNDSNSIQILIQFVELAQKSGAFLLPESDLLKRCRDVLIHNATDAEVNASLAKQLLIQAVTKGQAKGAYSLDDASVLHKVCQYLAGGASTQQTATGPVSTPGPVSAPPAPQQTAQVQEESEDDDDLNSLSAPVPLKTPKPKVV